jgi:hypothetical protein
MITAYLHKPVVLLAAVFAASGAGLAQGVVLQADRVPMKVEIVISHYDGDRKISSAPYALVTIAGFQTSLRRGQRVPVASAASGDSKQTQYVDVGTNIDCTVSPRDNSGLFRVQLTLVESSVLDKPALASRGAGFEDVTAPVFRNFSFTGQVMVSEGQSKQIVVSSDSLFRDVVKVDLTLTLDK